MAEATDRKVDNDDPKGIVITTGESIGVMLIVTSQVIVQVMKKSKI